MVVFSIVEGTVRRPSAAIVVASDIWDWPITASGYRHFMIVPSNATGSPAATIAVITVAKINASGIAASELVRRISNLSQGCNRLSVSSKYYAAS